MTIRPLIQLGLATAVAFCWVSARAQEAAYEPPPAPGATDWRDVQTARIGRIAHLSGAASYYAESMRDAGWRPAELNLPVSSRSSLATEAGARAEVRIGSAIVFVDGASQADFVRIDETALMINVARGSVGIALAALEPGGVVSLASAQTRLQPRSAGGYSLTAQPGAAATVVKTHAGSADVAAAGETITLEAGQQVRIDEAGAGIIDQGAVAIDEFDRWAAERSRQAAALATPRYLSADLTGAETLAANGRWVEDLNYGWVWTPTTVAAGWTPYSHGRWTWIEPWGRVWIDAAPWGFATSNYGRWLNIGQRWCWSPGAHAHRPIFAPSRIVLPPTVRVPQINRWNGPVVIAPAQRWRSDWPRDRWSNQHRGDGWRDGGVGPAPPSSRPQWHGQASGGLGAVPAIGTPNWRGQDHAGAVRPMQPSMPIPKPTPAWQPAQRPVPALQPTMPMQRPVPALQPMPAQRPMPALQPIMPVQRPTPALQPMPAQIRPPHYDRAMPAQIAPPRYAMPAQQVAPAQFAMPLQRAAPVQSHPMTNKPYYTGSASVSAPMVRRGWH